MTNHPGALGGRAIKLDHRLTRTHAREVANSEPLQSTAIQVLLLSIATLAVPVAWLVPAHFVLPSISIAALGLAGIIATIAWIFNVTESKANMNLWDVAGILALIGFGASMLGDPQAVAQLLVGRNA